MMNEQVKEFSPESPELEIPEIFQREIKENKPVENPEAEQSN